MNKYVLNTPVVLLIFNRSDTTQIVLEKIRQVRPKKLIVVADGPRKEKLSEDKQCEIARQIIDSVDWDCQVLKNYSESNLGCKNRISSGLDWAFEHVDRAIILEDDCDPDPTFFQFCEELLEHYYQDDRIMAISGNNFQFGQKRTEYSYYFSRYPHCWGWATWRRAWQHFDAKLSLWPLVKRNNLLNDILKDSSSVQYWNKIFQRTYNGEIDSWAYCWTLNCWLQSGLTVLPKVNLVSNIGFGASGTHTQDPSNPLSNLPSVSIAFPLSHPPYLIRDLRADKFTQMHIYGIKKWSLSRLFSRFKTKIEALIKT
ncbi:hemolytic protein HlpA-like protein [Synechococcus sp. PCC 7336]|uniref:hemolytic protein HlpA-like protein n=1 Tax=Synechococcus sp. PCC 7336 TaxID=195250 RepID=UPI0008FC00E3|nr:hemolytic protein HlpA-like protein [Synechococcus sp. PCC 7336]